MAITVFSKPHCVQCTATIRKLDALGLAYRYVDVTEDLDTACRLRTEGHRQMPVVEADGEVWSGYQPELLEKLRGRDDRP